MRLMEGEGFSHMILGWILLIQETDLSGMYSPSPRLKDAVIPKNLLPDLYAELLIAMRRIYHSCRLVHADLSEYNIL